MDVVTVTNLLREKRGNKSIAIFAMAMGIQPTTYFKLEKGDREISIQTLKLLVAYFKKVEDNEMLDALAKYVGFGD